MLASRKSSNNVSKVQNTHSSDGQSPNQQTPTSGDFYDHSGMLKEHEEIRRLPRLGPTPAERTGHQGWREDGREDDDAYWREFLGREVSFRIGENARPEDLELPPQPMDRYGKPVRYSAAVHYDEESGEWVPTSEEEEERLRRPYPIQDPFYVGEAEEGELHTSLFSEEDEEREEGEGEGERYVYGGLIFEQPIVTDMSQHRRRRLGMNPGSWRVIHLGTSSAIPTSKRNVSSTAVLMKPRGTAGTGEPAMFLVDAGENTDDQLLRCDWCMTHGFRWIRAIFITHLHGDHLYGLPMLLANIGKYAQYRRRKAVENGYDGSDPVIRVFGPYGTRGFVRASLYWTNPVGVRFSISELVPREKDFRHIRGSNADVQGIGEMFVHECGSTEVRVGAGIDVTRESPPPHPEEERTEDIHASEDGIWHVWEENEDGIKTEVVAAPLRHRLPCFGYVFRESEVQNDSQEGNGVDEEAGLSFKNETISSRDNRPVHDEKNGTIPYEIDKLKAKQLGVHGTQLRVLRSGRSVTVSKTGLVVKPEDVAYPLYDWAPNQRRTFGRKTLYRKKVTILGDTSDSSAIAKTALDSDLLVHEATFTEDLKTKARLSMHSTASMAGAFGRKIRARKIALTHFSSRYEVLHMQSNDRRGSVNSASKDEEIGDDFVDLSPDTDEDMANPNQLVREAMMGYGDNNANIIAAYDFLEHDIEAASNERPGTSSNPDVELKTAHAVMD